MHFQGAPRTRSTGRPLAKCKPSFWRLKSCCPQFPHQLAASVRTSTARPTYDPPTLCDVAVSANPSAYTERAGNSAQPLPISSVVFFTPPFHPHESNKAPLIVCAGSPAGQGRLPSESPQFSESFAEQHWHRSQSEAGLRNCYNWRQLRKFELSAEPTRVQELFGTGGGEEQSCCG